MAERLFALPDGRCASDELLVTLAAIAVYDRGSSADRRERFEAELASYAAVRAVGGSPWEAVHRLVSNHRPTLEWSWSSEGLGS